MHKELIVDFSELSLLSIGCAKCKTRVLLDCTDAESNVPARCPTCSENYDDSFRSTLHAYRNVYRELSDPKKRQVEVRIASPLP